tara:strand:- start:67 stop:594 length:528 start_codon:yes stop_codon:yes gene_type:complete
VVYDILSQKEDALVSWFLLYPIVFYILFLFSKDKRKPLTVLIPAFCALYVVLFIWSTIDSNKQLNALKYSFKQGNYETIEGKVTFESFDKQKRDGVDSFVIDTRKILRFHPERSSPAKGCWTGFVMKQGQLLNSLVKIDFINYPKWTTPPFRYGDEKVDVMCILRIERIGNNPDL